MIPDRQACVDLLVEAGCSGPVIEHVKAVAALAVAMARRLPDADQAIVLAGALLHDVGRGFDQGPAHVPEGIAFLRAHDVDEAVVRCVARHMGAGIPADQARRWGWPEDEVYEPGTMEETVVAHADNLTAGPTHVPLAATIERYRAQGLDDQVPRLARLEETLTKAVGLPPSQLAVELDEQT